MKHRPELLLFLGLAPVSALAHPGNGAHAHFETGLALVAGLLTAATIKLIAAAVQRKRARMPTAGVRRSPI
jgi:cobalamin biosynthesis protein CbiG